MNEAEEEYLERGDEPTYLCGPWNGLTDRDGYPLPPHRYDCVDKPIHYTVGGYEAIDVIKAKLTPEEWVGGLKWQVLKYLMRANYKGQHNNDCLKAEYYAKELGNAIRSNEE